MKWHIAVSVFQENTDYCFYMIKYTQIFIKLYIHTKAIKKYITFDSADASLWSDISENSEPVTHVYTQ